MGRIAKGARALLAWTLMVSLVGAPACSDRQADAPKDTSSAEAKPASQPVAPTPTPEAAPVAPDIEVEAEAEARDDAGSESLAVEQPVVASDDLRAMVSPVALYPDPLLGLVLQGSTQPAQVVLAQRFLERQASDDSLQPDDDWDDSVVGLLNYPEIVGSMSDSLDWTQELGQAVADDLDGVQLAVQELRWTAYQGGVLRSNEYQDVVVARDIIAILPAKQEAISVPDYDGADLLEASSSGFAQASAAQEPGSAGNTVYVQQPAAMPISYASPAPSFWSTAAVFAGGAVVGGLLGYAIGNDDDDDDWDDWDWDDDWDHRPWRGGYGGDIDIDRNVNINNNFIRPARPSTNLRPNRPIVNRPGAGLGNRPGGGIANRPGGIGNRPTTRPARPRPIVGKPGEGFHQRPGAGRPRPGGITARPGQRPPGVAPGRPAARPGERPSRPVAMPRPGAGTRPGHAGAAARPANRPGSMAKPPAMAQRPSARPGGSREHAGALAKRGSPPQIQRERARGAASRRPDAARRGGGGGNARAQAMQHRGGGQQHAQKQRPAMKRQGGGGGGGHARGGGGGGGGKAQQAGARGRASRGR